MINKKPPSVYATFVEPDSEPVLVTSDLRQADFMRDLLSQQYPENTLITIQDYRLPSVESLHEIYQRLREFYTDEEAAVYLCRPHPQLEGKTVLQMADEGRLDEVDQVLRRLAACAYV